MNIRVSVPDADLAQAQREVGWTETRTRVALALFASGLSDSQVACLIGKVTRNAVIGKRNRSGINVGSGQAAIERPHVVKGARSVRAPQRRPEREPHAAFARPSRAKPPKPVPRRVDDLAIPIEQRRTLFDLDDNCCRWPVGDPALSDFFFCGAAVTQIAGERRQPYCASHAHRAREQVRPRKTAEAFVSKLSSARVKNDLRR
jgi:GcrA cell cycle regulator